jgi:hypothetical protein
VANGDFSNNLKISIIIIIIIIINSSSSIPDLGPVWAGTRVQSGDRYGSGTLQAGEVLRGSLQLIIINI